MLLCREDQKKTLLLHNCDNDIQEVATLEEKVRTKGRQHTVMVACGGELKLDVAVIEG